MKQTLNGKGSNEMSRPTDIEDDEIRVISSGKDSLNSSLQDSEQQKIKREGAVGRRKRRVILIVSIAVAVVFIAGIIYAVCSTDNAEEIEREEVVGYETVPDGEVGSLGSKSIAEDEFAASDGFVSITDTIVNGVPLKILSPRGLTPTLHIGSKVLKDSTVKLAAQAADIRSDNGGIVGTYVVKGELISKGQKKSGFCAIIGGKTTVGVADATPYLEQALESEGYFFRQYPLVVANQIVENRPKGKSLRKALAELNGEVVIIIGEQKQTFHEFSQTLVDLGVANAIYLVGSTTYGFAIDEKGEKTEFGVDSPRRSANTNYIVWR